MAGGNSLYFEGSVRSRHTREGCPDNSNTCFCQSDFVGARDSAGDGAFGLCAERTAGQGQAAKNCDESETSLMHMFKLLPV